MTFLYIALGLLALGITIFRMGGKEIDRRLTAVGGLRKMYAPLIDIILSKPKTVLLKNTPSRIVLVGQTDRLNYMWQISTPDGKKITIRITIKCGNQVVKRKDFDFPISLQWQSEEIMEVLPKSVRNAEIFS